MYQPEYDSDDAYLRYSRYEGTFFMESLVLVICVYNYLMYERSSETEQSTFLGK